MNNLNKIFAIARKEIQSYFKSAVAYILLIVTISVFNIFFFLVIDHSHEATLKDMFKVMSFLFVFLIPMFTMRVFSQEKQSGTIEFLMTTPTTNTAIVLGKYLGTLIFYSLILLLTTPYYFILKTYGDPEFVSTVLGYVGLWLEGALFIAIGIMFSSWTRNQVIAGVCSYCAIFMIYFSIGASQFLDSWIKTLILYISSLSHLENFMVGVVVTSDLVYYISGIAICLLITRFSIENRLWR